MGKMKVNVPIPFHSIWRGDAPNKCPSFLQRGGPSAARRRSGTTDYNVLSEMHDSEYKRHRNIFNFIRRRSIQQQKRIYRLCCAEMFCYRFLYPPRRFRIVEITMHDLLGWQRLDVSAMQRSGVRSSVCLSVPSFCLTLIGESPGGSSRRGQRTFPSEYYEDGHTVLV